MIGNTFLARLLLSFEKGVQPATCHQASKNGTGNPVNSANQLHQIPFI